MAAEVAKRRGNDPTESKRGATKHLVLRKILLFLFLIHEAHSEGGAVLSSLNYNVEVASRLVETSLRATFENKGDVESDERLQLLLPEEVLLSSFQMQVLIHSVLLPQERHLIEGGKWEELYELYRAEVKRSKKRSERGRKRDQIDAKCIYVYNEKPLYRTARAQKLQIKTKLGPNEKFVVSLGYTYLLRRKRGLYHVILYLPELKPQDVHLDINVRIMGELQNLTFLKAEGKEMPLETIKRGIAEIYSSTTGEIKMKFHRNINSPSPFTAITHHNPSLGNSTPAQGGFRLSFQPQSVPKIFLSDPAFVLSFDVERYPDGGNIQIQSGYFVHFLSPEGLPKLPVHTVFVLDISGSMGELGKLANLKKAMKTTLKSLKREDSFEIFVFSINVKSLGAYTGSPRDIIQGIGKIMTLRAYGGTNINDALLDSVDGANYYKQEKGIKQIVFLTDGNRTVGEMDGRVIRKGVKEANSQKIPIYALAFGNDADMKFLRRMSSENGGFARKIRSDGRPAEQLQGFYEEISTPLLTDLDLEYPADEVKQDSVVKLGQDSYFSGDEVVLAGKLLRKSGSINPKVSADGAKGRLQFKVSRKDVLPSPPKHKKGVVERIWAYLSVQDLLSAQELIDDEIMRSELRARALEIALTYNFVTRLTSLVINDHTGKRTGLEGGKGFYPPHMGLPASVREEIAKGLTLVSPEAFAATLPNELQVDNDPHFVVQVSGLALPLCFDLHGKPGNILSLVRDDVSGLIVNAEVSAAIGRPGATYFTRLFLSLQRLNLTITTNSISVSCFLGDDDNQVSEVWHDTDWTPKNRKRKIRRKKHSGKSFRRYHKRGKRFKRGHSHQRFRHWPCSSCEYSERDSREEQRQLEQPSSSSSSPVYSPVIDAYLEKTQFNEIVPLRHRHMKIKPNFQRRATEHYRKYVENFQKKGVVNHYLYSYPTNKGNNLLIRSSIQATPYKTPPQKTVVQNECNKEFSWEHVTQRRYSDVVLIVRGRRRRRRLDVIVSDVNLHVVITNTKNREGQSFLGFYIQEQKILSPNTTGVIGQFVYKSVGTIGRFPELYSNPQNQENRTIPLAVIHLPQGEHTHPRVTRVSAVVSKRRSLLHRERVLCLHVKRHGRGLLAKRSKDYLLPELYS